MSLPMSLSERPAKYADDLVPLPNRKSTQSRRRKHYPHLRLLELRVGLLIHFHEVKLVDGIRRIANGYE